MLVLLFFIYLFLLTWVLTHTRFFTNSGLSKTILIILFLIKISIAVFFGWASKTNLGGFNSKDTWAYHDRALEATKVLMLSPKKYIAEYVNDPYNNHGFNSLFSSKDSYWNTLKDKTFIYFISILNCFTFGNYYINAILFSFLMMFGLIALYKVNQSHFTAAPKLWVLACTFLVPSFLFWYNAVSKDAVVFLVLSMAIYLIYTKAAKRKFDLKSLAYLFISLFILFLLRNHVFFIFLPALFCLIFTTIFPKNILLKFIGIYFFLGIVFFGGKYIHPSLNFPAYVLDKQTAFLNHNLGGSTIEVKKINTATFEFIKQIPEAIYIAGFTPTINQLNKPITIFAFIEIMIFWISFFAFCLFFYQNKIKLSSYGLFVLFFSISILLMIGFTNNNIGAIVRYRSILFPFCVPFIILPLLKYIKINKIKSLSAI